MNLVVGATGLLGSQIVRLLRERGLPVRALVRATSSPPRLEQLGAWGAEVVQGDLRDSESIRAALRGVTRLVTTASVTLSRQPGDTIDSVDAAGQLALVALARESGVEHIVYVSFAPLAVDCALQRAKRSVERALAEGEPAYTVLQPVNFSEVWLSPAVGFDPQNGTVAIFGAGQGRNAWISYLDVAEYAADAVQAAPAHRVVLPLGGPEAMSQLEVVELFERLSGKSVSRNGVSVAQLEQQLRSAPDAVSEAFAALMINTAAGWTVDASLAHRTFPRDLRTVATYARSVLGL